MIHTPTKRLDQPFGGEYHPAVTQRLTSKERKHIEQISGGSRLLAELAVDAISLRSLNADLPEPCLYRSTQEFIVRHGWLFPPKQFPAKYRKWRRGLHGCFENSLELAVESGELAYVEGFALPPEGISEQPTAHAWCVDSDGNVVDPTWHTRMGGRDYCGLAFDKGLILAQNGPGQCRHPVLSDHVQVRPSLK